jgi:hypothetical protein
LSGTVWAVSKRRRRDGWRSHVAKPSRGLLRGMVVADRQRRQLLVADLVLAVQREQRRRDVGPA